MNTTNNKTDVVVDNPSVTTIILGVVVGLLGVTIIILSIWCYLKNYRQRYYSLEDPLIEPSMPLSDQFWNFFNFEEKPALSEKEKKKAKKIKKKGRKKVEIMMKPII